MPNRDSGTPWLDVGGSQSDEGRTRDPKSPRHPIRQLQPELRVLPGVPVGCAAEQLRGDGGTGSAQTAVG